MCICIRASVLLLRLLEKQASRESEISLFGKTGGIAEAFSFSHLAQPAAAQPLSHWEAHVIEIRH